MIKCLECLRKGKKVNVINIVPVEAAQKPKGERFREVHNLPVVNSSEKLEWYNGLNSTLKNEKGIKYIEAFMKDHYCDENLRFWKAVEEYKITLTSYRRKMISKEIYQNFIRKGANDELNISHEHSMKLTIELEVDGSDKIDIFEETQREIFLLISLDTYPKFLEFIRNNFL